MERQRLSLIIIFLITFLSGSFLIYKGSSEHFSQFVCQNEVGKGIGIDCSSIKGAIDEASPLPSTSPRTDQNLATISAQIASDQVVVVRVIDGDTIEAQINGQNVKIRYLGVDTPETVDPRKSVQCYGKKASEENKRLVEGKVVELDKDISDTDKYGRLLRFVYLKNPDGTRLFVNYHLIRSGFARVLTIPPDVKYQEDFLQAQTLARQENLGLWKECS